MKKTILFRVLFPAALLLITAAATAAPAAKNSCRQQIQAMRLQWFRYDSSLPLNAVITPLDTLPTARRFLVHFQSVHDQTVPAILALPDQGKAPYPCVLLMHGSGGNKDSSYVKASSIALTQIGCATLSLDAQYCGARRVPGKSGDIFLPNSYTARDAWVQTVIDLRRAVDYLQTRKDIDVHKLGYLGFSQGAMLGAVFGGVDKRVAVFCLAVPGGDLTDVVRHIARYPILREHWPIKITPQLMRTVENVTSITDPVHYIGGIAPRPLLIFTAKYDQIIPPEASQALLRAAANDKNMVVNQVDASHVLNPMLVFNIRAWFQQKLLAAHIP